ncbi:hypothetical protein TRVL_08555 [Trypanosoma vivax]|nr:hypothetical protein TRVL_08555 [Trypanosoma vivax]
MRQVPCCLNDACRTELHFVFSLLPSHLSLPFLCLPKRCGGRVCVLVRTAVVHLQALPPGAKGWPDGEELSDTLGMGCVEVSLRARPERCLGCTREAASAETHCLFDRVSLHLYAVRPHAIDGCRVHCAR